MIQDNVHMGFYVMDTWVVSTFQLLWIMLLWTRYRNVKSHLCIILGTSLVSTNLKSLENWGMCWEINKETGGAFFLAKEGKIPLNDDRLPHLYLGSRHWGLPCSRAIGLIMWITLGFNSQLTQPFFLVQVQHTGFNYSRSLFNCHLRSEGPFWHVPILSYDLLSFCSGLTPNSVLTCHSWRAQGSYVLPGIKPDLAVCIHVPFLLCYSSGPKYGPLCLNFQFCLFNPYTLGTPLSPLDITLLLKKTWK